MKLLKISLIIATHLLCLKTFAQQTDFTGAWVLKERKAVTGPQYANGIPEKIKVEQRKDSIIVEYTYTGDGIFREGFAANGNQTTRKSVLSNRKLALRLAWAEDKRTLILTTIVYLVDSDNEIDFTRVETWTLNGNQLTIDKKSLETTHETWQTIGIFQKE